MNESSLSLAAAGRLLVVLALVFTCSGQLSAAEITVQNDSLLPGDDGNIQAGFVGSESAAVWLTAPCDGNIVAIQVFWRSLTGGTAQVLGEWIKVYDGGAFPQPGAELELLEGPLLTDGVLNEFRFLDEFSTVPISIPVTAGQTFVVSYKFSEAPDPFNGPSLVTDVNGCQPGKNAIEAQGLGWISSCLLGVTGDFVIRAVVDCGALPGACCVVGGGCSDILNLADCTAAGGSFHGEGTNCSAVTCLEACCFMPSGCLDFTVADCLTATGFNQGPGTDCLTTVCFATGACCNLDGSCDDDVSEPDCIASGGTFQGNSSLCSAANCPQPTAACCLSSGGCLALSESDCGVIPNSSWAGFGTDCSDVNSNGTADDCEAGATISSAESMLDHGGQDLALDLTSSNVEPRSPGILRVDFQVSSTVASVSASVSCVTGTFGGSATVTAAGTLVTVDFSTALPDADCCTITLSGDASGSFDVRPLRGDIDRNGVVSTGDASVIKPNFGQNPASVGAQFDFDANGVISTGDASQIKPLFGNAAACP